MARHGIHERDFAVTAPTPESALEDASDRFEVGPYFVEVKATRSGRARLTPAQADTASARQSRYVLCVVDLTGVDESRLDGAWAAADVESLASLVPDIGGWVNETCVLVHEARDNMVGIRTEGALRYEVPEDLWRRACDSTRGLRR